MRRGAISFLAGCVAIMGVGTATAGDEKLCSKQYSFDEQVILEWAAMGGDPHAQFALSQCSFPENIKKLTDAQELYALKWVTLAACDVDESEATAHRDRVTRDLKAQGDLSYRRFGGVEDNEKFSRREKRFQMYRDFKTQQLDDRLKRLMKRTDDAQRAKARYQIAEQMTRMGPIGTLRLATLSECKHFGASTSFRAAAWTVAANTWEDVSSDGVYGKVDKEENAITSIASRKRSELRGFGWDQYDREKERFGKYIPERLAELERDASLARLENLKGLAGPARIAAEKNGHSQNGDRILNNAGAIANAPDNVEVNDGDTLLTVAAFRVDAGSNGTQPFETASGRVTRVFDGPAVTMATQYALEALGFMEFINGPDNDYGPSTIEAVAKAQEAMGHKPTRWLTSSEARDMVCRAASDASDPVSYYHVGMMYKNGWGYTQHLAKARYAMAQAESVMDDKLSNKSDLEPWKSDVYPEFKRQILEARKEVDAAWASLPAYDKNRLSEWEPRSGLCN